jgi:transposase-like protein
MYVQGVSTRKVKAITQKLCGLDITSTQVSRAAALLDEELEKWRNRDLGEIPYVILDARYEKIRHGGSVIDCAILIATGVQKSGKRIILGVSVSLSEAEVHWRNFLQSLQMRGLRGVTYVLSDAHKGLKAALRTCFVGAKWQRCQFHLQQNAGSYVPKTSMREEVAAEIRTIFTASTRVEANRLLELATKNWEKTAPSLAEWAQSAIPEGLQVFELPAVHRKRMRTTNMLERLNREIKRRTRVATLFPNEASALRLITALLVEQSEEWESGTRYLDMRLA